MVNSARINLIIIALVSAGVSYLCFGILESTADGTSGNTAVSGAIAGFLVTAVLLYRIFQGMNSDISLEIIENQRREIKELQNQVIRGAPYPEDFTPEISDREKIVIARPKNWQQQGGYIFNFEENIDEDAAEVDPFPAYFRSWFNVLTEAQASDLEAYFENITKEVSRESLSFTHEVISIGGDSGAHKAQKMISTYWIRVGFEEKLGGKKERVFEQRFMPDEFVGDVADYDRQVKRSDRITVRVSGSGFKEDTTAFCKGEMLETSLNSEGLLIIVIPKYLHENENYLTLTLRHSTMIGDYNLYVQIDDYPLAGDGLYSEEEQTATLDSVFEPEGENRSLTPPREVRYLQTQRILVVCRSSRDRVMFFDYEDNIEDILRSTKLFNSMMDSIRFL